MYRREMNNPQKKNGIEASNMISNSTAMFDGENTCGEKGSRRINPRHRGNAVPAATASHAGASARFRNASNTKWNIPPDPRPNSVIDSTRNA